MVLNKFTHTSIKLVTSLGLLLTLFACSSGSLEHNLAQGALETLSGDKIGYNQSQCTQIKAVCPVRNYSEWQTVDVEFGCSCKDGQTPQR